MTRPAALVICIVASLASSGCVVAGAFGGPGSSLTIHIPTLRVGDVWRIASSSHYSAGSQSGAFADDVRSEVLPGIHQVPDRFGLPVDAVLIKDTIIAAPERDFGHTKISQSNVSFEAIEANGGNWLRSQTEWTQITMTNSFDPSCAATIRDTVPSYAESARRYDAGSLMGRTLSVGDVVSQSWDETFADTRIQFHQTVRIVGQDTVRLVLDGADRSVPALVGDVKLDSTFADPALEAANRERPAANETNRIWLADGVAWPVRSESNYSSGPLESTSASVLEEFRAGTEPLPIRGVPPVARFDGLHPDAHPTPLGISPTTIGANLVFSWEDALNFLQHDPRAVKTQQWLAAHPSAYTVSATYERDDPNQTYSWMVFFTDGGSRWLVEAKRQLGPVEPLEDSVSIESEMKAFSFDPQPGDAHELQIISGALAFHVIQSFLPTPENWTEFGWSVGPRVFTSGQVHSGAVLRFFAAPGGHDTRANGPLQYYDVNWHGFTRSVDGTSGGMVGGFGAGMGCGGGVDGLPRLPVLATPGT